MIGHILGAQYCNRAVRYAGKRAVNVTSIFEV